MFTKGHKNLSERSFKVPKEWLKFAWQTMDLERITNYFKNSNLDEAQETDFFQS